MPKIKKRFIATPIIIAVVIALLGWLYVQHFPWQNGYRVGTGEYAGYQYADQLRNADECNIDPEMLPNDPEFQAGCRAYFE